MVFSCQRPFHAEPCDTCDSREVLFRRLWYAAAAALDRRDVCTPVCVANVNDTALNLSRWNPPLMCCLTLFVRVGYVTHESVIVVGP